MYAQAAAEVEDHPHRDPSVAARRFLAWLAEPHGKTWLVVLDDLAQPADLDGLWPPNVAWGRTVVTTRRRDAALDGDGRTAVDLGLFTPDEAATYLHERLGADPDADALAADLGHLPLALGQAAAYMKDKRLSCGEYRVRFAERQHGLDQILPADGHHRALHATWSLSIEAADAIEPVGEASRALELASLLDPHGIPLELFERHDALTNLQRLSLVRLGEDMVHVHQLVQRTVREGLDPAQETILAKKAAQSLHRMWPEPHTEPELCRRLRASVDSLWQSVGDVLLHPATARVLLYSAQSLLAIHQFDDAYTAYLRIRDRCTDAYGPHVPPVLLARAGLASIQGLRGEVEEAVEAYDRLLDECREFLGPADAITLAVAGNRARWRSAGPSAEGEIGHLEAVVRDCVERLGPDHEYSLKARSNLISARRDAGDLVRAHVEFDELYRDRLSLLGPDHPDTLITRNNLAQLVGKLGDPLGALTAHSAILRDRLRVLGPEHPHTFVSRSNIAEWKGAAGNPVAAARDYEEMARNASRVFGADHQLSKEAQERSALWHAAAAERP
ncbi:tetratricopeptide repeat protein [Phytomonospora endophytica]|uniref:Tetratricopeptide (TPR) repeat protein n=1 Tax=Phytomonospora endophytica TaxID=714109 RepID=A0A841FJB1_9ACTN|nr:tetratricopeptide repeat protein [Phytomonospora endophytica]MBB6033237.1 tetratricopeptide (TPR) repeat protein [Phytomonospora endophytica]